MENLLDIKEVSAKLMIKESTLRAWVFQRRIPFIRLGRLVRFKEAELVNWIRDKEKKRS
ncbi:MAG: helix-turn-helix domain-containing protein [Promethearchaeota archaeon]